MVSYNVPVYTHVTPNGVKPLSHGVNENQQMLFPTVS